MDFNGWKFFAGIGIFIYAMILIEDSLKNLAGRSFKRFLQRSTGHPVKAIAGGTVITAMLQSSSLVSLMVLAFVGVGIITMPSAFAVILGSNLGTTLDSWVVASLGFKLDLESYTFPIIGITILSMLFFEKRKKIYFISKLILGIGFLFLGIEYMKSSATTIIELFDIKQYAGQNIFFFSLIGFVITMLIQSSSATVAITLATLNEDAITLTHAAAVVVGSEVGTTIKILLGSIGGNIAKKRVAWGNIIFNLVITILALMWIDYLLRFITQVLSVTDPLIALVSFQTLINFTGVLLFVPFLKQFTTFIEKVVPERESPNASTYVLKASDTEEQTALDALEMETHRFLLFALLVNKDALLIDGEWIHQEKDPGLPSDSSRFQEKNFTDKYEYLKRINGEVMSFYSRLQQNIHSEEHAMTLHRLINCLRNAMYSAKSMKDIVHDCMEMKESSHDEKHNLFLFIQSEVSAVLKSMFAIVLDNKKPDDTRLIDALHRGNEGFYKTINTRILQVSNTTVSAEDVSSMFNMNREIYLANKHLLLALSGYFHAAD